MKRLVLSAGIILASCIMAYAQPITRPMNNFIADQNSKTIEYQKVFDMPSDSAAAIKKKLKALISQSSNFTSVMYDSTSCTGMLGKVYPSYFKGNKEMTGFFKIEVKNGRYRVTITQIVLKGSIFDDNLESIVANNNFTEWEAVSYDILPELDSLLTKVFTPSGVNDNNW